MKIFFNKKSLRNLPIGDKIFEIIKKYKIPKNSTILEIGCGDGRFGSYLGNKFKKYRGTDPDKEYIYIAKKQNKLKNVFYKLGYAEKIPFKNKFDIVFFAFSWHFVKDFEKAIIEIKRILKKDGILIILEPSRKSSGWASPVLNKDSPLFNKLKYKNKILALKKAEEFLKCQNILKIIYQEIKESNIWVLKK